MSNNKNEPAFPPKAWGWNHIQHLKTGEKNEDMVPTGLTKREYYTILVAQTLLNRENDCFQDIAESSIKFADILLKMLEEK